MEVVLAAGEIRVVTLTLEDDARNDVSVNPVAPAVQATGICGDYATATIGTFDCDALRVVVALDNTHSRSPTRFRVEQSDIAGELRGEVVELAAGELRDVSLELLDDNQNGVLVRVQDGGSLDGEGAVCGMPVHDPSASFSDIDCDDVTADLTLDNGQSTTRAKFLLLVDYAPVYREEVSKDAADQPFKEFVLQAGEVRTIHLHLPIADEIAVVAVGLPDENDPRFDSTLVAVSTRHCARSAGGNAGAVIPTPTTSLAATGSTITPPLALGSALLALGLGLLRLSRRPPRAH